MIRRWRERRTFKREIAEVSELAEPGVSTVMEQFAEDVRDFRRKFATLPGANPVCPECGGRLEMKPVHSRSGWHTLWVCDDCRFRGSLSDLPRRKSDVAL